MAVGNFQSPVINNISVSTVTNWISRCHIADICCGSDIMVVWPCGPDRLHDFLKPHVTDSDNESPSGCPFHQKGTINDLQDLFTQKLPIQIAILTLN